MVCRDGNFSSVYPFCSISCFRTSAALKRVYRRLVWKLGSVWLWESTMSSMSSSKLGRCSSAGFRPRAEKASIQLNPLSSSRLPLRIVPRFHSSSSSAYRCPPLLSALTTRAMKTRRSLPLSTLAVSIKTDLNSSASSIASLPITVGSIPYFGII